MAQSQRYNRQADLVTCRLDRPIVIVGAGGIGSFLTLTLAKMGFSNITVFDNDTVEEHNLPNQFYREEDIGEFKVVALANLVKSFTGMRIVPVPELWAADHEDYRPPYALMSAVDNMATRRQLFAELGKDGHVQVFMDGRMGANQIEVYTCASIVDKPEYEKLLWQDTETAIIPCTSKATMYTVLTIASFMSSNLVRVLSSEPYAPRIIMDMFNMNLYHR